MPTRARELRTARRRLLLCDMSHPMGARPVLHRTGRRADRRDGHARSGRWSRVSSSGSRHSTSRSSVPVVRPSSTRSTGAITADGTTGGATRKNRRVRRQGFGGIRNTASGERRSGTVASIDHDLHRKSPAVTKRRSRGRAYLDDLMDGDRHFLGEM